MSYSAEDVIKYREAHGCGILEAKAALDAIDREQRLKNMESHILELIERQGDMLLVMCELRKEIERLKRKSRYEPTRP